MAAVQRILTTYTIGATDPVLSEFMQCRAPFSVLRGPLGSGKTIGTVQRILLHMVEQEPNSRGERHTRFLAIRNFFNDLVETTVKDFLAIFEPEGADRKLGFGRMKYGGLEPPNFKAAFNLEDGTCVRSEVIFLALDRPDSVKKLKGYQVTWCWFNELSEIAKPLVDMADLRHGRFPSTISGGAKPTYHGVFGDTNSYSDQHWLYEMSEKVQPVGWEFFSQPGGLIDSGELNSDGLKIWVPNPKAENLSNLPEDYYERGQIGKSQQWVSVNLANEYGFVQRGVPVHPRYSDSKHCVSRVIVPLERYPLIIGIDFGRTPAAVILQYWEHLGQHVVIDELTSHDMSAAIFGPELKRKIDREYPGFPVQAWGDPAGDLQGQATEDSPIRIIKASGIPCKPTHTNVLAVRLAALDNPLTRMVMNGQPGIIISGPKCPTLRQGLAGAYHYRELQVSGERRINETPNKTQHSHVCESLHYALVGCGEGALALRPKIAKVWGRQERQETADSSYF